METRRGTPGQPVQSVAGHERLGATCTLAWNPTTTDTGGQPVAPGRLLGYRLYSRVSASVPYPATPTAQILLAQLADATQPRWPLACEPGHLWVVRAYEAAGESANSNELTIPVPVNQPPLVTAGPDQTVTTLTATLTGTVTDDGLPAGSTLTRLWSGVSGPGTVTFATPTAASTVVTVPTNGVYTVRLTASDGALSTSDDVVLTVAVPPLLPPGQFRLEGVITLIPIP